MLTKRGANLWITLGQFQFAPTISVRPGARSKSSFQFAPMPPSLDGAKGELTIGAKIMVENFDLWGELKPVDNFPDYRLSEVANRSRCHRCQSAVWHLIDRAGFEVRLDPERIDADGFATLGANGKTYIFPTMRMGDGFVTGFLKTTADDIADADFDKTVYLAWHRCNPENIRTDVIDHWRGKR